MIRSGDTARTYVLTDDGGPTTVTVVEVFEGEGVALVSTGPGTDPYEVSVDCLEKSR